MLEYTKMQNLYFFEERKLKTMPIVVMMKIDAHIHNAK